MCLCKENNWCRDWRETQNGKYPRSNHAPGCNEYKEEEFTVLEYDGSHCVMERHEAEAVLAEASEVEYVVSKIMLTRDQFDGMAEFQGF